MLTLKKVRGREDRIHAHEGVQHGLHRHTVGESHIGGYCLRTRPVALHYGAGV
ncbi:MAG TPA: hypothetical protein VFH61_00845 [Thermoleophilia bacterium]|nr:hypothetical protein [Thermoleophilia bacterium]